MSKKKNGNTSIIFVQVTKEAIRKKEKKKQQNYSEKF